MVPHSPEPGRQILAASFATAVGMAVALATLILLSGLPKTPLPFIWVLLISPPIAGSIAAMLTYRVIAKEKDPANRKSPSDQKPQVEGPTWPTTIWSAGLAIQIAAYILLLVPMQNDVIVISHKYRNVFWIGYNVLVGSFMVMSLASIFWARLSVQEKITSLVGSVFLFAVMYLAFLSYASWLSTPTTIPYKLSQ